MTEWRIQGVEGRLNVSSHKQLQAFSESESNISNEGSGVCYPLFSSHDYAKCCYCFMQYLTWGTLWIPFAALFSYSLNGFFSLRGHSHSFLKNYQNNQVHLMNWYKSLRLNFKGHLLSSVISNKKCDCWAFPLSLSSMRKVNVSCA